MYFHVIFAAILTLRQSQVFGGGILRGAEDSDICESEDCQYAANHILKWLNPVADPCEDFYDFACGNWRNLPIDKRENTSLGSRDSLVQKYIPDLIKDPSATKGRKPFEKLRSIMIACTDEDNIKSLGVTPLKQLIQKAGGWPVLDADWSEEDWDFLNAEITLGGAMITVDTTYFEDETTSENIYLIKLGQPSLIHENTPTRAELVEGLENESTKAYYDLMVDVAVALGADKGVAEQAMKEVLEFETAFIKELENTDYSDEKITFRDLQEAVPWIDLSKLLEEYLPESFKQLPEETVMGNKEYFLVLDKFINQYPAKTFVNYMVSKAVYPLLNYVYHDLKLPPDTYPGYVEEEYSRFDFCSEYVKSSSRLGPAMAAYLGIMYADASQVASEITKVLIDKLSKEVRDMSWMDEVTREQAAKNISEIKMDVGFPPNITDLDKLDAHYKGYDVDTSNYFEAVIYDLKWGKKKRLQSLNKDNAGDNSWYYYVIHGFIPGAGYNKRRNSIGISGTALNLLPLFSPENPAYVNYGQVGTSLGILLSEAVDFNAAPADIYGQREQCFTDLYSSINDATTTQLKLNATFTKSKLAHNAGLKLSLGAYRNLANQLGSPERKLLQLQQYSTEQLFMISLANALCEIPDKEKRISQLGNPYYTPTEFKVYGVMMNSPDFSEIFNCNKNDPMNPPDKCEVW